MERSVLTFTPNFLRSGTCIDHTLEVDCYHRSLSTRQDEIEIEKEREKERVGEEEEVNSEVTARSLRMPLFSDLSLSLTLSSGTL